MSKAKRAEVVRSDEQHGGGGALAAAAEGTTRELQGAAQAAAAEGFEFDSYSKLKLGQFVTGRFVGFGTRQVQDDAPGAKPGAMKEIPTVKVEVAAGMRVEMAAAHQIEVRLQQEDVIPGKSSVYIQRGEDVRTPAGRVVTEYLIGVRN